MATRTRRVSLPSTAPYYFGEFARIYPAFDGVTPNGIKYGAALEIRQNSGGIGINNAFANGNGVAGNTLYWRRQTGYVSMEKLGTIRFGQTDGVQGLVPGRHLRKLRL